MDIDEIKKIDPADWEKEHQSRNPKEVEKKLSKYTKGKKTARETFKTKKDAPGGGYTKIPNRFIIDPNLKKQDKLVIQCLYYHAFGKKSCYPSQKLIHKESGVSLREVKRSLKRLQDKSFIEIKKEGRRNVYYLKK